MESTKIEAAVRRLFVLMGWLIATSVVVAVAVYILPEARMGRDTAAVVAVVSATWMGIVALILQLRGGQDLIFLWSEMVRLNTLLMTSRGEVARREEELAPVWEVQRAAHVEHYAAD